MINTQYKIQPVAAFYRLLGKSFLFISGISLLLSTLSFFIVKLSLVNALGNEGIKEMGQFLERKSTDMMEQSKAMQDFILKYPGIMPALLGASVILLFLFSYLFYTSQQFLKKKSLGLNGNFVEGLIPTKSFFSILLFLLLISGFLVFTSGFIALSISANPVIGIIAGLFLGMLFVRNFLFIPGLIIGEMNFSDSLKYSFQTISLGRAFKIIIFGTLIFLMLSFILSALVYFPSLWFPSVSAKMFINIFVLFLQIGCISVGMTSLFLRYGNFEEEKIAE